MSMSTFRHRKPVRYARGFSLIELMIALVLGLLVVGAAFAIFQSNQLTYRSNEGLNRMQENARVAFEMLSQDIRAAGGNACSKYALLDSQSTDAETVRLRDTPVTGTSSELRLVGGDSMAFRVLASTNNSVTLDPAEIPTPADVFDNGDLLLLCNPDNSFIVEVGSVTGMAVAFSPNLPVSDLLGTPARPATAMLAQLRDVRWFTADNGRGGTSLFVSRMGGAREEVAEGIEGFTVAYLHDTAPAGFVATPTSAPPVVAVRITMTLRGQDLEGRPFTRQSSQIISLRKGSLG